MLIILFSVAAGGAAAQGTGGESVWDKDVEGCQKGAGIHLDFPGVPFPHVAVIER
jgi:hypothetical protein